MGASTTIKSGGIVTFSVKVNGSVIPDETRVYSIHIEKGINRIPLAKISVLDGDASTGTFAASSSGTFLPGNKVVIEAGYDSSNKTIFAGIITKQTIRIDDTIGSMLIVECRDVAVKMIVGRKNLTFSKKKDSDIISSIIGTYSGLSSDVSATSTAWPEQVQYYATDWDFILARAEANGFVVNVIDGKVTVAKPDANTSSVLEIEYGNNLHEFNAELNSVNQLAGAKANSWDYKTQKVIDGEASNSTPGPGNLSAKKLSEVVGLKDYDLTTGANLEAADLTNWAKAQLVKSSFAKIRGDAKFQGTSLVDTGDYITLAGLGDRFNGDHLVSGVIHDISGGNWFTEATIGLSDMWFTEEPDVMAPPASGLLPGASGLFNGTVKKMYEDPDTAYRILVEIPLFDAAGEGIWARLSNFYSTSGAGAFFMPEVGDEVVVGFLNEDPRYPVILGSLYSEKNKPFAGLDPAEKNPLKAIVSKSGIYIQFDDENKVLTLTTPGDNKVIFSDKDKSIMITDQNSNKIEMTSSGITMSSPKDITIKADGSLNLKGTQGVNIEASGGDVKTSGLNIKSTASMEFSAEGSATASVQGGAQLTLKAAMVMIN
ncbi:MAG: type VI secretion system tip protein VgrG [Crocinitomix sp.]|nr:type VI secretion system tip protein VgrG [Crocinitomix sp.]